MTIHNLDKIFRPAAIAVVGASEKKGSIGWALLKNLREGGFQGEIFPVNPHHKKVNGLLAYPSVTDIGRSVDAAVIATPIKAVPSVIENCGQAGIEAAVIISAGGKETGQKGVEIEQKIRQMADKGGVRIIGPNCLGVVCAEAKLNASFAGYMPLPGTLAFVSQSGAIYTAILDLSLKERIGFSYFVSVGSMLDVDFGDLINYLGNDPKVGSIILYIESLTNFRNFMSAARAVSLLKPIVALKAGKSPAGARAAASHTGAMAGEDAVYDAAFERCGIVRVHTFEELFDCSEIMAKQPRPSDNGLAVITNAGGPGVMAADAMSAYGAEPVQLSDETLKKLGEVLPPFWSRGNPVDILGDADPERYRKAVEICLAADEVNGLLIIMVPQALTDPAAVAELLCEALKGRRTAVFTAWMGGNSVERGREIFNRAGIPTYDVPERAIRAFMLMHSYTCNLRLLHEIPERLPADPHYDQAAANKIIQQALESQDRYLNEADSKELLAAYGIPVNPTMPATSADDAVRLGEKAGFPVVMKIDSPDISHKSDAKGVLLNLRNADEVRNGFHQVMQNCAVYDPQARLPGVTLQPMLKRPEYELIVGSKKDAHFGPVILFGMGGTMTEILHDRAIALPPLNRLLARRLIEKTKVYKMLSGYRNQPPANLVLLEEILVRLSQLVTDFPEIVELDINPLFTIEDQVLAVDARVVVGPSAVPSPLHLVISPYPDQYEMTTMTKGGLEILIRPIKPEDAPLLVDLFNTLSPTSIYFRFFRPMRHLSHEMLARFTQIDYDRDMSLVALQRTGDKERMLGVARLISDPDLTKAEFSVAVGDPWQGKGVGAELLEQLVSIARERGLAFLWGVVLAENTTMLALGRKLGFSVSRVPQSTDFELKIDLQPVRQRNKCGI